MNYMALMLGAFGLVSIVTVYYLFNRKPAAAPAAPERE
jgi:hypothetical protein